MSTTPRHILLLEGDSDDAEAVNRCLREGAFDAKVSVLQRFAELAPVLRQGVHDILISNFQLSDGTALDVLRLVRELRLDLPVIVLSDGIGEELAVTAMHAGAHDFITKRNLSRLVPAIERELEELAIHRRHREAEAALRESEQRFRQLTENIGEVLWLLDVGSGEVIYLSPAFEDVWERPTSFMRQGAESLLETIHPEDYAKVSMLLKRNGWLGFNAEYRIQLADGSSRWIGTTSFPIRDEQGAISRVAGLSIDISERKRLTEEREMLSRALEQSADAVMITGAEGRIVYVNPAFEAISGYRADEVLGDTPAFLKSGFQDAKFYRSLWKNLLNGLPFTDVFINRRKDGELYYEAKTITPVRGTDGELTHFVSTGKDITNRLKSRQRLHTLLNYDAVTGLANSVMLQERLEQAILLAAAYRERIGVLCVGMSMRELLGDIQSRRLAEKLEFQVAQRLNEIVGSHVRAARLSDDEFVLLLKGVEDHNQLEQLARQLVTAFAEPVKAEGYELFLSPAVGISLFPDDGVEGEVLVRHAQQAMEYARTNEQDAYGFYAWVKQPRDKHLSS